MGVAALPVTIEVFLSGGLPACAIVGLAEAAVRESKDRVRGAIMSSNFNFPQERITVSLGPADMRKSGGRFDLGIALGILVASGQVPEEFLTESEFYGELALNGELRKVPGILPLTAHDEAIETAAVNSVLGLPFDSSRWRQRPFREPHHSASAASLVGGGSDPRPGEISRAHNGVLFLDELPEFSRHVLDVLREPLETGHITISRVARQADFPARFQLVAAMNPCPCGYLGDPRGDCCCSAERV